MLAIKLHRTPKPFLGKGSYLIPVTTWQTARSQIRNWLRVLANPKDGCRNTRSYITLVKLPDNHPVILDPDWIGGGNPVALPLKRIPRSLKDEIIAWYDYMGQEPGSYYLGAKSAYAQLILGAPLPRVCVKWTKDIRLLYRGDKRRKRSAGK